jgi:hypothetical protein
MHLALSCNTGHKSIAFQYVQHRNVICRGHLWGRVGEVACKFIILDVRELTPGYLLGLAAITLALGATYLLMRERDDRLTQAQ